MHNNVGIVDMLIRLLIAAALGYIGYMPNPVVSPGTSQNIIKVVAFLPLLTGLSRFCPLYRLIGLSTCGGSCKTK